MKIEPTALAGVLILEPRRFGDARGWFTETWNAATMAAAGLDMGFVQDNHSCSVPRHTLRGLHYQRPPHAQDKLVRCTRGAIRDVAVDIRRGSPTFGRSTAVVLSAANKRHFWIPEGFAHGFVVLSERALFSYLVTAPYDRAADAGIRWDDASLAIDWPVSAPLLSEKDADAPFLADVPADRLPVFTA